MKRLGKEILKSLKEAKENGLVTLQASPSASKNVQHKKIKPVKPPRSTHSKK